MNSDSAISTKLNLINFIFIILYVQLFFAKLFGLFMTRLGRYIL
ncbi:Hypothetical protein I595_2729 [Croceitalea dokdonensis DOKDO 023]|uniref:Uncharacterized protein n=1 Tax=Croceitalea dokdonensis DOKDO 023 TaxID=1300341 RepID=A0A0P7AYK3_9FLAO|nr:Hypothetical protein I595_2729 [Croceitalea dokdonensis DOKDO 023]